MRLAAGLDVQLDAGMALLDPPQQAVELGLVRAGEQRQDLAAVAEQALRDGAGDLVEVGATRRRPSRPRGRATHPCARRSRRARRRARRRSPRRSRPARAPRASPPRSRRRRGTAGSGRSRRARPGPSATGSRARASRRARPPARRRGSRSSCSAARAPRWPGTTRSRRGSRTSTGSSSGRPRSPASRRSSRTGGGCPRPERPRRRPSRACDPGPGTASSSRSVRCSVCWCMFAISTPSTVPIAVPSASARPGSSVWTWILSAVGSPTTRSESPNCSSSVSSVSASSSSPSITKTVQ